MITKDITIEDLVEDYPKSVNYLSEKGIRCIKCGEPIWGTLEEACKEKGFTDDEIENVVKELIALHNTKENSTDETPPTISGIKKIDS